VQTYSKTFEGRKLKGEDAKKREHFPAIGSRNTERKSLGKGKEDTLGNPVWGG